MASCISRATGVDWLAVPSPIYELVGRREGHVDGPVLSDVSLHIQHSVAVRQALPHVRNREHRKGYRMRARRLRSLCGTDVRVGPLALVDARARLVPWLVVAISTAMAARQGIHDSTSGVGPALQIVGFAALAHDPEPAVQVLHPLVPNVVGVASVTTRRGAIEFLGTSREVTDTWHVFVQGIEPRVGAVVLPLGAWTSTTGLLAMRLLAVVAVLLAIRIVGRVPCAAISTDVLPHCGICAWGLRNLLLAISPICALTCLVFDEAPLAGSGVRIAAIVIA
mmetsp:Transcript_36396/g.117673  ORF Transcript_36396/g.117673 Transcript_36396/m.117673 type:complete len:280 (-) Transcript_36396:1517-2356(-)